MNAQPVTVIATFEAGPGKEAASCTALIGRLAPTRKEAGCLNYDCHQSADDPGPLLFPVDWTSKAHLDAHLQSAPVPAVLPRRDDLCTESPHVRTTEPRCGQ